MFVVLLLGKPSKEKQLFRVWLILLQKEHWARWIYQ